MTPLATIGIGVRHAEAITGLTAAAAFLETHPDLPLNPLGDPMNVSVTGGSDEDNRAEVDRIAWILGVEPGYILGSRTHYAAVLHFAGGVTYSATAINRSYRDNYDTATSYIGSVHPLRGAA